MPSCIHCTGGYIFEGVMTLTALITSVRLGRCELLVHRMQLAWTDSPVRWQAERAYLWPVACRVEAHPGPRHKVARFTTALLLAAARQNEPTLPPPRSIHTLGLIPFNSAMLKPIPEQDICEPKHQPHLRTRDLDKKTQHSISAAWRLPNLVSRPADNITEFISPLTVTHTYRR